MNRHTKLEDEVSEVVRKYLWYHTEVWALEEGIDSVSYGVCQKQLGRLEEIAEVIGLDRVRAIWAETRATCRAEIAEMVRGVVRPDVIEDWLDGRKSTRPAVPLEEVSYEWPDPFDAPSPEPAVVEFDPELAVRDGLGRVMQAMLMDLPVEDVW